MNEVNRSISDFLRHAVSAQAAFPYSKSDGLIDPSNLFSPSELENILQNPLLTPDWLQLRHKGQLVDLASEFQWKNVQRKRLYFLSKSLIEKGLSHGASLVLEGLDILSPAIGELVQDIDQIFPCVLSNCEAFLSQKSSEAYDGHRDSDDVLVIQIAGQKNWEVFAPQQRRYTGNSPLTEDAMAPLLAQFTMGPGDCLYVKAGVPHRCTTPGDFSLHLSFDLCDRTPNVEQITHAANQEFNKGLANHSATIETVIGQYIDLIQSPSFQALSKSMEDNMKVQVKDFRQKIRGATRFSLPEHFKK
jgi:ribosomal protein L16 Arg81 hydroxylase